MTTKHTPGPWVIKTSATYRSQVEAIDPKGRADVVARIEWAEASDANARLIAAAPDLLAALNAALAYLVMAGTDHAEPTRDAIRAAIAKARQ